jgi:hypothetical protein
MAKPMPTFDVIIPPDERMLLGGINVWVTNRRPTSTDPSAQDQTGTETSGEKRKQAAENLVKDRPGHARSEDRRPGGDRLTESDCIAVAWADLGGDPLCHQVEAQGLPSSDRKQAAVEGAPSAFG